MLKVSLSQTEASAKCTPNLLPCRINHDGPVNASAEYWTPENNKDGNSEAYFRGRKLEGRSLKVPEGYKGIIIKEAPKEDDVAENSRRQNRQNEVYKEEDDEQDTELDEIGSFDEVILWGHESMVEEDDAFSKGMGEWIGFAEAVSLLRGPRTGCEALLTL